MRRSSTGCDPSVTRIAVGDAAGGLACTTTTLMQRAAVFVPDGATHADDPMLLYFTSGTTAKPKLVLHSHRAIRSAICRRCTGSGLQPGDVHLNISSPGWAKHAWSCFFAPWNAGATVFIANQPRFDARGDARCDAAQRRDDALRAADGVAHADPGGSRSLADQPARGRRGGRAAQSGSDRAGARRLGPDHPRRLRPDRDHGADRQPAGPAGEARLDGPAAAGYRIALLDADGEEARGGRDLRRARPARRPA